MLGRYGNDDLNRCLMKIVVAAIILSLFTGRIHIGIISLGTIFYWLGLLGLVYSYFRMFSRNIYKRSEENRKYLQKTAHMRGFWQSKKRMMEQRKVYHIYTCPGCKQKIRIPKGKGKIEVRCPKCGATFIKRS